MFNRSNIEEANKHLQALYGRVSELEHVIAEQHDALLAKDSFIQTKVKELSQQDSIILALRQQLTIKDQSLEDANQRISQLEANLKTSSDNLEVSLRKSEALGNIVNIIPELKSLVMRIEDIAISVDEGNHQLSTNDCNSTTNSSTADDNTDVTVVKEPEKIKMIPGSVSEMAKEFNMQTERLKKFSISEDEDDTKTTERTNNTARLKEFYF